MAYISERFYMTMLNLPFLPSQICDTFHSFVQPELKPTLSKFCKTLTGIKQETVDNAPFFDKTLQKFESWLEDRQYFTKYR